MPRDPHHLSDLAVDTLAVHLGRDESDPTGALVPPIHPAAAFAHESVDLIPAFRYSRRGNPTRRALERALAALHGARYAFAFGSGMGAVTAAATLLESDSRVILPDDLYSNTHRLFTTILPGHRIRPEFLDLTNLDVLERALGEPTAMVWLESPTNPSMKILDIAGLAARARAKGVPVVVDNSYASPYFQKPLALGADLAIESTTKYLNGHDDLMGGAVMTNSDALAERLALIQYVGGAVPSPFDCWLLLRGIKTLALRMERHQENALAIARFLAEHPKVASVRYPGLPGDPGHEIARRQMTGYSGMIAFEVVGGPEAAKRVVESTRLFQLAGGLGGVESLISYPATGSGASQAGTFMAPSESLVRLSVGIENPGDLMADLADALEAVEDRAVHVEAEATRTED
jgi:cystathionine gamma-synthase